MTTDVLVIGAGPAGASVARLLAAWGHRVLVIHRPGGDSERLAESIPPSANKALAAIGARNDLAGAGFLPWRGNTVWWGSEAARVESFSPDAAGYQVVRADFDCRLRDLAAGAGAAIRQGRVLEAHPGLAPFAFVESSGATERITARILIDASGRAGVIARQLDLRIQDASPHTIAIAGAWRHAGAWPVPDDTHTLVASYADGWAWSVPTGSSERHFSVMVDPARTNLARGAPSRAVYLNELAKVRPFAPILEDATLVDGPWGADASVYAASDYAGEGFLLVGDAGSAIDPLSSFGVKKALASAWLAAVVTNTVLVNPALAEEARVFFSRRERTLFAGAQRQARRFAEGAAAGTAHPFWMARSESTEDDAGDEVDAAALANDPAVLAAFADLRARPSIQLVAGPDVRVTLRPAVRGREIVMEDHVVSPASPHGLRYLRGVNVVTMLRLAPSHQDVGDLYEAVNRSAPSIALPDFLGVLSVMVAKGVLVHSRSAG